MAEIFGNTTTTPLDPTAFSGGGNIDVDQTYNPESENAQSGKAVAEAIANIEISGGGSIDPEILNTKMDKFGEVTTSGSNTTVTAPNKALIIGGQSGTTVNGYKVTLENVTDIKPTSTNNNIISMHGARVNNIGTPTADQDAVTKKYVDDNTETLVNEALAQAKASGEFNGANGTNGKDGTSVTVKSVSESTADSGSNVVTFSDGKTLTVKNGSKGSNGSNGADGKTPVKGTDYFTEADKTEIVNLVLANFTDVSEVAL